MGQDARQNFQSLPGNDVKTAVCSISLLQNDQSNYLIRNEKLYLPFVERCSQPDNCQHDRKSDAFSKCIVYYIFLHVHIKCLALLKAKYVDLPGFLREGEGAKREERMHRFFHQSATSAVSTQHAMPRARC